MTATVRKVHIFRTNTKNKDLYIEESLSLRMCGFLSGGVCPEPTRTRLHLSQICVTRVICVTLVADLCHSRHFCRSCRR